MTVEDIYYGIRDYCAEHGIDGFNDNTSIYNIIENYILCEDIDRYAIIVVDNNFYRGIVTADYHVTSKDFSKIKISTILRGNTIKDILNNK
jgi:hypothetical protein